MGNRLEQQEKLFTKAFVFGWFLRFFNITPFMMLMATITPYCMAKYGCTTAEAGLAAGIFVLVATILRLFAGRGVDVFGRRRALIVGSILYMAFAALYLVPMGYVPFVLLRAVHGAIFGWVATAVNVVSVEVVPRARLGEGIGYYALATSIAFGQLIGVTVFQNCPAYMLFVVATALCAGQLVLSLLIPVIELQDVLDEEAEEALADGAELGQAAASAIPEKPRFSLFYLLSRAALPLSLVAGFSSVCYSSVTAFIEPYSTQLELGQFASAFFIVYSVVLCLVRPGIGKLVDKGYEKPIMTTAFILFGVSYVVLANSHSGVMLMAAAVFLAIGFSGANSNMLPIILKSLPRRETSLATATYFLLIDAGTGSGPALMGLVVQVLGYQGMYVVDACVVVVLAAAYLFLRRNVHYSRPQKSK